MSQRSQPLSPKVAKNPTEQLLALVDCLVQSHCTIAVMESTESYWKPVYNLLEGALEAWVVNAQHVKALPGRKTDVKDAEWAELLQYGLVHRSYIPSEAQRERRELVRSTVRAWCRNAQRKSTESRKYWRVATSS